MWLVENSLLKLKSIIPLQIKRRLKIITNNEFKKEDLEKIRLQNFPRFTQTEVRFLNRIIRIVDIASFQFIQKEIFEQEIYKFESKKKSPYIIDCGANIGLSVIYFKTLFPDSEIVAFEPDNKVFDVLQLNIKSFDLTNVELIKKACWHKETVLKFFSEGADGGRAASELDKKNIIEVETIRLRKFLNKGVDSATESPIILI
jgi:FkbM family methyltransferase